MWGVLGWTEDGRGHGGFSVCMSGGEVVRVPTADQIFIEFHSDGHEAFPRLHCAASRENGTNTNTSSDPPRPHTSWSLVIKLRYLIDRVERELSGTKFVPRRTLVLGADHCSGHLFD